MCALYKYRYICLCELRAAAVHRRCQGTSNRSRGRLRAHVRLGGHLPQARRGFGPRLLDQLAKVRGRVLQQPVRRIKLDDAARVQHLAD